MKYRSALNILVSGLVAFSATAANADDTADAAKAPAAPAANSNAKKISDITDIIDKLDYPELQVVPRASQRLKMEATDEETNWYYVHWPVEIASLATLYLGITGPIQLRDSLSSSQTNDFATVTTITKGFGLTWLTAGLLVSFQRPYRAGIRTLAKTSDKGERGALLRERLAEEGLERPAKIMRVVTVASVVTNFTSSLAMGIYMSDQGRVVAGVSALLSFLPLVFEDHSVEVFEKHLEYKKKIYSPLPSASLGLDPRTRAIIPMTQLTWNF